ncbi:MAG: c-type cytochrome [Chloroflexi bacterium]|nr:c-type cytochrome [Chloroflexota bacterium]
MKRMIPILMLAAILTAALALVPAQVAVAQDGHGPEDEGGVAGGEYAPQRGAALYAEFCQACHGPQGEAAGDGPAFVAIEYDPDTARAIIAGGLDTTPDDGALMPAYGEAEGGLLDEAQLDDLLAYMATWETGDTPPLPAPNIRSDAERVAGFAGDPEAGAVVYAASCYGCHGAEGQGRGVENFPGFDVSGDTLAVVRTGTGSDTMPGFVAAAGGPLSEQQLDDLDAYLASWTLPPDPAEAAKSDIPKGTNVLLIVMGAAAILVVGAAYMSQVVRTET